MAALSLIRRNKGRLIAIEVVAVAVFALELALLRSAEGVGATGPLLALGLLPPLVATAVFFPLLYLAWFGKGCSGWYQQLMRAFFWLAAFGAAAFWLAFYWAFVLQPATVAA
ncbi:hypothetical protein ACFFGH_32315 [Lysobacter korlensis]|uniref:Transmembrane protein n=1 Tax=Lysobacter korlensis TaxID=553636 RepID=A0ABV6RZX8_9GAMM